MKCISDSEFVLALKKHFHNNPPSPNEIRELANKLLVSAPTINRWLKGKNLPHEALREGIVNLL